MVHGMLHKKSLFHFVAQKVTLMRQLKIKIIIGSKESPSCTNELMKLPFMQKCPSRIVAIKFLKDKQYLKTLMNALSYVFAKFLRKNDVNSK